MEATTPFWLDERYTPRRPLRGEEKCSIAVVGGGVVGVSSAYFLAKKGCKVVLLERGAIGSGATGRSAGFLLIGPEQHYSKSCVAIGQDRAREVRKLSLVNHE
ncbi:MAG: FAD-dependent oxidoreductase, partial [Planctomycetota bacterium]